MAQHHRWQGKRVQVNFDMSEERARFSVEIDRGRIDGNIELVGGLLTLEDKRRLGIGGIFEAPSGHNRQ